VPAERLQRLLARAGYGSRRAVEQLIVEGRVTVDGRVAILGDRAEPLEDEVRVDGAIVNLDPNVRYYALHKPAGVVTTMRDPQGRTDIRGFLPEDGPRVFPVGRLDRDSEGLLLLTNDGGFTHALTHPRHGVTKTYVAEVPGQVKPGELEQLRQGVMIEGRRTAPAEVRLLPGTERAEGSRVELVLREGRKRQVRRMLSAVGHRVRRLTRTAVGPISLGSLKPGQHRELTPGEVVALLAAAAPDREGAPVVKRASAARPAPPVPVRARESQKAARPPAGAKGGGPTRRRTP
jgi:23S rRNA pseudouridine2605 synthase